MTQTPYRQGTIIEPLGNEENISGDNQNGKGTNNKRTDSYVTHLLQTVYSVQSVCCDNSQQVDLDLA